MMVTESRLTPKVLYPRTRNDILTEAQVELDGDFGVGDIVHADLSPAQLPSARQDPRPTITYPETAGDREAEEKSEFAWVSRDIIDSCIDK